MIRKRFSEIGLLYTEFRTIFKGRFLSALYVLGFLKAVKNTKRGFVQGKELICKQVGVNSLRPGNGSSFLDRREGLCEFYQSRFLRSRSSSPDMDESNGLPRISSSNGDLKPLVARTGRHQQRYQDGYRLVAGCVPFRYRSNFSPGSANIRQMIEVLMVTTQGGPGLLFPKGGWETDETVEEAACREAYEEAGVRGELKGCLGTWDFKSKRQQGDCSPDGLCRAYMHALVVTEELDSWPEQHARQRHWFTAAEALENCRYEWMKRVLEQCISHLSNSTPSGNPSNT